LLNYADGEKRYVLAWQGIKVGDSVSVGAEAPIAAGNRKQLKDIPEGMNVYNLEITPFSTGKVIKSAGSAALISGRDEAQGLVFIKMPSGEVRKFNKECWATIGILGNEQHKNIVVGKAGRQRWLGKKPRVLGKNMNPVDHPHGGGEAHSPIGSKQGQKSFSGKRVSAGMKTRKSKKWSTKFIVSGRKTK
jgi:large subunit ribosomal protein L2